MDQFASQEMGRRTQRSVHDVVNQLISVATTPFLWVIPLTLSSKSLMSSFQIVSYLFCFLKSAGKTYQPISIAIGSLPESCWNHLYSSLFALGSTWPHVWPLWPPVVQVRPLLRNNVRGCLHIVRPIRWRKGFDTVTPQSG